VEKHVMDYWRQATGEHCIVVAGVPRTAEEEFLLA